MKITPMMKQYLDAKERYPDSILFFRMGDFYEMFFEDAVVVSRELGLTLTARNKKGNGEPIPMAGVPHHAAKNYINNLIKSGFAVAICEQLEDPSQAQGIVRRDVVRVVTPGVVIDTESLDAKASNYVASVVVGKHAIGIAHLDVSTGSFRATEVDNVDDLVSELNRFEPREIVAVESAELGDIARVGAFLRHRDADYFGEKSLIRAAEAAIRLDRNMVTDGYFCDRKAIRAKFAPLKARQYRDIAAVTAASQGVLRYIVDTQRGVPTHVKAVDPYYTQEFLVIDASTKANLELTQTLMGAKRSGSLLGVIDRTVTAMGGRLLRDWLNYPLVDSDAINARLEAVEEFVGQTTLREDVRAALGEVYDLERLCGRISAGSANARDMKSLLLTLRAVAPIKALLRGAEAGQLLELAGKIQTFDDVCDLLDRAIVDAPPVTLTDGGLFKRGFDADLDGWIELSENGKDWVLGYEQSERERTNISSLKVRYNKVFGYYLEVTRANLELVPDDYVRKQTLTNAERFFTPELKEMEERILSAEEKRRQMEYDLFETLRKDIASCVSEFLKTAIHLAALDVLSGFGELAVRNAYVRPQVQRGVRIEIEDGRHPVVEQTLMDERFVPNSVELDCDDTFLQLITGPNMAGKSTVIRQVALIVLMAQMGSFVPAKSAKIGTVDKIFSRVGASDNLARGQSTFMVEMTETAHILRNATSRSLVILDEIGRGTSTFDGLSIAWAVAEHLHNELGVKTMFATHYHELTELTRTLDGAINMSIAVKEWQDDIIFLRKLVTGQANRSYGVQVGRLAGLPDSVVARAKQVLCNLEAGQFDERGIPLPGRTPGVAPEVTKRNNPDQMSLFGAPNPLEVDVLHALAAIDLDALTPRDALNTLYELRSQLDD